MNNDTYSKAYVEVLEILKHLSVEEYNKIPKSKILFFEKNKDKNYIFKYDNSKKINEQKLSRKAKAIIVLLYMDFFATDFQKGKIEEILDYNERIYQNTLKEKYNLDNLFKDKKHEIISKENESKEQSEYEDINKMVIYKENILTRLLKKIIHIFKK